MLFERRPDWHSTEGQHQHIHQYVDQHLDQHLDQHRDQHAGQRVIQHVIQRLDLAPLDPAGSGQLADQLLARLAAVPPVLRELLTTGAQGNPFYMEELVKMLIDQGAIRTGGAASGAWQLDPARLQATEVPATLTGVLQARLDGLPAAERLCLQEASIIGLVFWDRALAALNELAPRTLPALVQRALAVPHAPASSAAGDDTLREYAFEHHILHQVTYATVLKRSRRLLHGRLSGPALALRWRLLDTRERTLNLQGEPLVHSALQQARGKGLRAVESLCLNALAVMASMQSDAIGVLDHATQDLADSPHRTHRPSGPARLG